VITRRYERDIRCVDLRGVDLLDEMSMNGERPGSPASGRRACQITAVEQQP